MLIRMPDMTSIKVPRALRDRLAVRAAVQQTTLAGALSSALDDAEAQLFWSTVRAENARSTRGRGVEPGQLVHGKNEHKKLEQEQRERGEFDVTSGDDLADPADEAIGTDSW